MGIKWKRINKGGIEMISINFCCKCLESFAKRNGFKLNMTFLGETEISLGIIPLIFCPFCGSKVNKEEIK